MVIPIVWYSSESKTTSKSHLGILSNTWYAQTQQTCKTMHEHVKNLPKYMLKCHMDQHKHNQSRWDKAQTRKSKGLLKNQKICLKTKKIPNPFQKRTYP